MMWINWVSIAAAMGRTQQPMTIDDAVKYAVSHSFAIQVAKSNIDKANFNVAAAKGTLGPSVGVSASADHTTSSTHGTVSQGGQGGGGGTSDSKLLQVSADLPIDISGNLHRSVEVQRFSSLAARANLESEINLLKQEVRVAYFSVLQAKALVDVYQQAYDNAVERLTNTKQLLAGGTVAKVNVIRADTQVSQAESDLVAAKNRLSLAKNAFNNSLARPINTPVELTEVEEVPLANFDRSQLEQEAIKTRAEIQALSYQIQGLGIVREAVRKGQAPNLSLSLTNTNNYFGGGFNNRINSLSGGAFLNFNLYDSGVIRAKARSAMEDEAQAKFNLDQLTLGVTLEVGQALTSLIDAKTRIEVAKKQVELATENYRLSLVRYKAGEGIQLETIDAQTDLTRANVGYVTARYDYLLAWSDLQKAVGTDQLPAQPKSEEKKEKQS